MKRLSRKQFREWGRIGGRSKSEKKAAAARLNGLKAHAKREAAK